ncbi:unnamed protein product [Parnassius apollo]|uniref:(apollo) hypothetical protein n=1 Tax=Parnassius apollo TaxID=110799 RepID=A0A8S3XPM2_PARAO|nr:unnamed protein product [Parnassius apollo]
MMPNQEYRTQVGDTFINAPRYLANIKLQLPTIEMPTVRQNDIKKEAIQLDLRNVDLSDIKELINSAKFSDNEINPKFLVTSDMYGPRTKSV